MVLIVFLAACDSGPNACGLSQSDFDQVETEVRKYFSSNDGLYPANMFIEEFLIGLNLFNQRKMGLPLDERRETIRKLIPKLKAQANKRMSKVVYMKEDEFVKELDDSAYSDTRAHAFTDSEKKQIVVNIDEVLSAEKLRGTLMHEYLHNISFLYKEELKLDWEAELDHDANTWVCDNLSAAQYNSLFAGTGYCFNDSRYELICDPNLDSGLSVTHEGDVHAAVPVPDITVSKPEDESGVAAWRKTYDDCGFEHVLSVTAASSRELGGEPPGIDVRIEADKGDIKTLTCIIAVEQSGGLVTTRKNTEVFMKATEWFVADREVNVKIKAVQKGKPNDLFLMTSVTWDSRMTNDPDVMAGTKPPECTDSDAFDRVLEEQTLAATNWGGTCRAD